MVFKDNLKEFKNSEYKEHQELFESLTDTQQPDTLFITCCDSRINPHLITRSKPGDLFVVRNIGNVVPKYHEKEGEFTTISAIEYAVLVLNVKNIIVCGHSNCGACASIWKDSVPGFHVREWLKQLNPVKRTIKISGFSRSPKSDRAEMTERLGVRLQLKRLLSYPYVREGIEKGTLNIEGWYYNIGSGEVEIYDKSKREYIKV